MVDDGATENSESPPHAITIQVDPANDDPTVDLDDTDDPPATGFAATFTEGMGDLDGTPVLIAHPSVVVADPDSPVTMVTVTLMGDVDNVGTEIFEVLAVGTLPASIEADESVPGVITFRAAMGMVPTQEDFSAAVATVTYQNTSQNPTGGMGNERSIEVVATDDMGGSNAADPAISTITVVPVNDAPTVDLDGSDDPPATGFSATFTEGAGPAPGAAVAIASSNTLIDDVDGDVLSVSVTLTNPIDTGFEALSVGTLPDSVMADVSSGLTITFTAAVGMSPTGADFAAAVEAVTYQNTSQNPTGGTERLIEVVATDDMEASNAAAISTITVVPTNDVPLVDLDSSDGLPATGFSATFTEGVGATDGTPVDIASANTAIGDVDGEVVSVTVTLTNPLDVGFEALSVGTLPDSVMANVSTGNAITFTAVAGMSPTGADFAAAVEAVTYQNTSQNPTGGAGNERIIHVVATDDMGASNNPAVSSITVMAVNDAPSITPEEPTATFMENGPASVIAPANLDIEDPDSDIATVVVTLENPLNGANEFIQIDTAGLDLGALGISVVPLSGFQLTLTGPASAENFETVLARLEYGNDLKEADRSEDRRVRIDVTDQDTMPMMDSTTIDVEILKDNDAPSLKLDSDSLNTSSSATYSGGAGVPINDDATGTVDAFDPDDAFLSEATVTIVNPETGDTLALDPSVTTLASDNGISVSFVGNVLTLTSNALPIQPGNPGGMITIYEQLLDQVLFSNVTDPVAGIRIINVQITDAFTEDPAPSNIATSLVTVEPGIMVMPTAALADLDMSTEGWGSETTFVQGDVSAALTGQVDVSDADGGSTLAWASVTLMDRPDGVWENVGLTPAGEFFAAANGVAMQNYEPSSGQLMLVGTADHSIYEVLLQSLVYSNTSASPTGGARAVEVVVDDGNQTSDAVTAVVNVIADVGTPENITLQFEDTGWVRGYAEGGVEIESLGDSATDNLYLNDNNRDGSGDLLQIQNGGPYEFSMGGAPFDMLSVDVVQNFGAGTWTASSGATLDMTPGTGSFEFPESFQGVTWVQWNVTSGLAIIDNVQVYGAPVSNLRGSEGNDLLLGTSADDVIDGLGGDDILEGGAGDDTFVFDFASGSDRVGDFAAGAASPDVLDLRGRGFVNSADVLASATPDGGDVVIDLGGGDEVRLVGIELSELHSDDFIV